MISRSTPGEREQPALHPGRIAPDHHQPRWTPGKKGVIYVSNGLPMIPGMDLFYEVEQRLPRSDGAHRNVPVRSLQAVCAIGDNGQRTGRDTLHHQCSGLEVGAWVRPSTRCPRIRCRTRWAQSNFNDTLIFMADETGGMAVFNSNDLGPQARPHQPGHVQVLLARVSVAGKWRGQGPQGQGHVAR